MMGVKRTTATDWLEEHELEMPEWIATELPQWMQDAIEVQMRDTFKQSYWRSINQTTRDDIERVLRDGLQEGMSIRDLAAEIRRRLGNEYYRHRSENIARTESGHALNAGRDLSIKRMRDALPPEAAKHVGKSWISVLGNTTRDTHAALDGEIAGDDGKWELGGVRIPWPGHYLLPAEERCNCFPAGTIVSGRFIGAQRAWYEGAFTEIILCSGGRLTLTPNHPIVTVQGLVPAGKIQPGQEVMAYDAQVNLSSFLGPSSNEIQHEPALIEDVFQSFFSWTIASTHMSVEVKSAEMNDFHGDGIFMQGKVEIVRPKGILLKNVKIGEYQKGSNSILVLEPVQLANEFRPGSHGGFTLRYYSRPTCFPSRAACAFDIFRRLEVSPSRQLSLGVAANFDSRLDKSAAQQGPTISRFLRDALKRHAGSVSFEDVGEVRNFYSAGHVYDLHGTYGTVMAHDPHYNTSRYIVTSNCQCTVGLELGINVSDEDLQAVVEDEQ